MTYEVDVEIKGITPLLMHRMDIGEVEEKGKASAATTMNDDPVNFLYKKEDGTIYQPAEHLERCLMNAGKDFKIAGKRGRNYSMLFGSMVYILPDAIPHVNQNWIPDKRTVVIPSRQGSRIVRIRPKFEEWMLRFTIRVKAEESELPEKVLKQVLEFAGSYVGIGDYRPQKKGKYGQFIVTRFVRRTE